MNKFMRAVAAIIITVSATTVYSGCGTPSPEPSTSRTNRSAIPPEPAGSGPQQLTGHVLPDFKSAPLISRVPASTRLTLAMQFASTDMPGVRRAVRSVSDPASPSFRHYMSPEAIAERFGQPKAAYDAAVRWATEHHLTVKTHRSRLALGISGEVGDIETALHTTITYRQRKDGTQFHAPENEPSLDMSVPVTRIGGLDDYVVPAPLTYDSVGGGGSEVSDGVASFNMNDIENAYIPDAGLYGDGQYVAVIDLPNNCFKQSDLTAYAANGGFTDLADVLVTDNIPTTCTEPHTETTLDLAMVTAMAPHATIKVFGGDHVYEGVLNDIADDPTYSVISCSWFGPNYDAASELMFDNFALQGQTFYQASGDNGAYSLTNGPLELNAPQEEALTIVGGTNLFLFDFPPYGYEIETGWYHSGGGIMGNNDYSADGSYQPGLPLPWYQATFIPSSQLASTTWRNAPDVSAVASSLYLIKNGTPRYGIWGTSAAAPIWAGFTALVNEVAAANGVGNLGFANPMLYAVWSAEGGDFHDPQSGSDSTYQPTCPSGGCNYQTYQTQYGYDQVTGLGTPTLDLLEALAGANNSWTWSVWDTSDISTAVTSFQLCPPAGDYAAWATDSASWEGTSPDHSIWHESPEGDWTTASGGAIQVVVGPDATPWILNTSGTVFSSPDGGSTWNAHSSGSPPQMSWIAVGALGLGAQLWAISKDAYEGGEDYTIWYLASDEEWIEVDGGARRITVSSDSGTPSIINHLGHVFTLAEGSWIAVADDLYNPWYGTAAAIAAGPNDEMLIINTTPWTGCPPAGTECSPDDQIFFQTSFNSVKDSAWSLQPGGAVVASMSYDGIPTIVNTAGVVFYGSYLPSYAYWMNSRGRFGGGGYAVDAGADATVFDATHGVAASGPDGGSD